MSATARIAATIRRFGSARTHATALGVLAAVLVALALPVVASAAPPVVTIDTPTEVETTRAHVSGSIDADEVFSEWFFEVSTDGGANWVRSNFSGFSSGPDPEAVSGTLEGLTAGTSYKVRLSALNFNEFISESSEAKEFTTDDAPVAPVATVDPAAAVSYTSAEIAGQVDPEGGNEESGGAIVPIHWALQISPSGDPGSFSDVAAGDLTGAEAELSSAIDTPASPLALTGLTPGHTYTYRLLATYAGQTVESSHGTFETLAVTAPTVSIDPVGSVTATSASLVGHVTPNAPGPAPQDPAFDSSWSFTCVPSCGNLSGPVVPADDSSHQVEAGAKGLEPNTSYTVTLKAANLGGEDSAQVGFETPAVASSVTTTAANPTAATTTTLNGVVNPHNSPTAYWFEWGSSDCAANPCQSVPASEDADAGSDNKNHFVSQQLTGLVSGTSYHYRLVADNGIGGPTAGEDRTFTTASIAAAPACPNEAARAEQEATALPDCRAYEMVSPPEKNGSDVMAFSLRVRAAANGDAVGFSSLDGFANVRGSGIAFEYMAKRTGSAGTNGWLSHSTSPRQPATPFFYIIESYDSLYAGEFSPDNRCGAYVSSRPLPGVGDPADIPNLYLRDDLLQSGAGTFTLLTDPQQPVPPATFSSLTKPELAGISDDCRHVIFESRLNFVPEATGEAVKLYEWADGTLRLAGILPDGSPAPRSRAGQGVSNGRYTPGMLSPDGSRVFFQTPNDGRVYMREDGTTTVQMNVSEKQVPDEPQPASLWAVSRDAAHALFTTGERLVEEDEDESLDLYMWNADAPSGEQLTLISPQGPEISTVDSVIGISADGSYVYFFASGQLVEGEPLLGAGIGLYAWHEGEVSFVGEVPTTDPFEDSLKASIAFGLFQSRLSGDGSRLLFMTHSDAGFEGRWGFDGYDHGDSCTFDTNVGGPCRELYLFDTDAGSLVCGSCNPSGATATADALPNAKAGSGAAVPTSHLSHAISADGNRVFFQTAEALLPADANHFIDVYEYDVPSASLHLVSSGTEESNSYFMDASIDGNDVFFATRQRLVGWDSDQNYDLYDARVGGGVPEPEPVPPACEGDSCRQPGAGRPIDPANASAGLDGPGNRPGRRCSEGRRQVKRAGKVRCVKKHHHKHKRDANVNRRASR